MNAYNHLEKIADAERRRKFIGRLCKSLDLSECLPEGVELTTELSVPSQDHKISLPFVVGYKYEEDEPYEPFRNNHVYVLGICRVQPGVTVHSLPPMPQDNVGFLVIDFEGEISYTSRNHMESLDVHSA